MNKVTFGVDIKYTKTRKGYKKSPFRFPKWKELKESVPIKKGQTVAMKTGEEPSEVVCIDVDTKDPESKEIKLLVDLYQLQPTVVQETQKGFHFFYQWDKRLAKNDTKVYGCIDIRSNGGLIFIEAPVPYYRWWKTGHELAEFTDEHWKLLEPKLSNKYKGIPSTKADEVKALDELIERYEKDPTEHLGGRIQSQQRKINRIGREHTVNYDDEKIQRAKDYPIRDLLNEQQANVIRCISPDHEDKEPSMQITGNFAFCHGCRQHFDSLSIYQLIHGCDFKTALNKLSQ